MLSETGKPELKSHTFGLPQNEEDGTYYDFFFSALDKNDLSGNIKILRIKG